MNLYKKDSNNRKFEDEIILYQKLYNLEFVSRTIQVTK